jgi:hypothetical protein
VTRIAICRLWGAEARKPSAYSEAHHQRAGRSEPAHSRAANGTILAEKPLDITARFALIWQLAPSG